MTIMNTELYEALIEAGASDEKAKAASSVVEEQNKRFDKIDNRFDTMQSDIDRRFDKVEHDISDLRKDVDHRFDLITKDLKITIGGYFIVAVGVILAAMKFMN